MGCPAPPPPVLLLSPFPLCALLRASWAQSSRSPRTARPATLGGWDVRGVTSERLLRLWALALAPHVLVGRPSGDLAVPQCPHLGSRPTGHPGKSTWQGQGHSSRPRRAKDADNIVGHLCIQQVACSPPTCQAPVMDGSGPWGHRGPHLSLDLTLLRPLSAGPSWALQVSLTCCNACPVQACLRPRLPLS